MCIVLAWTHYIKRTSPQKTFTLAYWDSAYNNSQPFRLSHPPILEPTVSIPGSCAVSLGCCSVCPVRSGQVSDHSTISKFEVYFRSVIVWTCTLQLAVVLPITSVPMRRNVSHRATTVTVITIVGTNRTNKGVSVSTNITMATRVYCQYTMHMYMSICTCLSTTNCNAKGDQYFDTYNRF
jgi:hypothetical protein